MTTLDRAFIKAYSPNRPRVTERKPLSSPATASLASAFTAGTLTADVGPVNAVPAPTAHKSQAVVAEELVSAVVVETESSLDRRPQILKTPLSSFVQPAKPAEPFRAMLEVDHLLWPEACVNLLNRARDGWNSWADQLAEQITEQKKCVALTSCQRGEGRTTIVLAAARHLGSRGLRCVVVDADFERPRLAGSCGISPQSGWDEVLDGDLPLGETLIAVPRERVTLMPWRGSATVGAQASRELRMSTTFRVLAEHFDVVLLDLAPLASAAAVADFVCLAEAIRLDAVYLVHDVRSVPRESLTATCATLRRSGIRCAGIVENFVPVPAGEPFVKQPANLKIAAHG